MTRGGCLSDWRLIRTSLVTLAAVVLAFAVVVSPAAARGTDHFFSGGLSSKRYYASGSAHTLVVYIQAIKNHNACVGLSTGWGGYAPPGTGNYYNYACAPRDDLVFAYPGLPPGYYHGAVWNPNSATNVSVADAHYSWD